MTSLLDAADREYETIQSGKALKRNVTSASLQGKFDFLTSEEAPAGPVHVVEIHREDARRAKAGDGPRDLSREEFAQQLGISTSDASDPSSGMSFLCVSEAMRAYYGDPQDEAYRAFRRQLVRFGDNQDWLKASNFTHPDIEVDVDRMHQIERWNAEDRRRELRAASDASAAVKPTESASKSSSPRGPSQDVDVTPPAKSAPAQRPATASSVPSSNQPTSGRSRAANIAANYRKKMQDDFKARKEL